MESWNTLSIPENTPSSTSSQSAAQQSPRSETDRIFHNSGLMKFTKAAFKGEGLDKIESTEIL